MSKKSEKSTQDNSTASRKKRLSVALKSNMAKRKAQARQRAHAQVNNPAEQEVIEKD